MDSRYSGADGIRGFACLIVLGVHAVAIFYGSTYIALAGMGKVGVWLFFVLSAFLLTTKFEQNGFDVFQIFSYVLGRFLRIIPTFVVVVLLYLKFGTAGIDTLDDAKSAILLRQGYAHLWTIPVEFKFYALLPVIAFSMVRVKMLVGQAGVLALAVVLIGVQQYFWPYWLTQENSIETHWYLSSFTIGCYFAVSINFYRKFISPDVATSISIFIVMLMVLASPIMRNMLFGMPMDKWLQNKFVYLSFLWGVFIIALADGKGLLGSVMKSTAMKKIGAWSFSLYLVHWLFYTNFASAHPNSFVWMLIGMTCTLIGGLILYYIIEAPIEKIRHVMQGQLKRGVRLVFKNQNLSASAAFSSVEK